MQSTGDEDAIDSSAVIDKDLQDQQLDAEYALNIESTDSMLENEEELIGAGILDAGAKKRPSDKNEHFFNAAAQAWPHSDIYSINSIEPEEESMNDDAIKK